MFVPILFHLLITVASAVPTGTGTGTPALAVTTSIPSPTLALNSTLPPQAPVPPKQAWCPSDIFCAGQLLQTIDIAQPYPDSKTFVDKPTKGTPGQTLADFNALAAKGSIVEGEIVQFLEQDFKGEGLELSAIDLPNLSSSPAFLKNVPDPLVNAWTKTVHGFWSQLARSTKSDTLCDGVSCQSSLIPLNHTFIVPGGRFREQYYWDSYFIIQGLIKSEAFDLANFTLQNFMDELERFGFIPNGGRIYYLNRSQPPLFVRMLSDYVKASRDTGILKRALPLAEVELQWWQDRRTLQVTSPYSHVTHTVAHYAVRNSAPRPESYLADYQTAHGVGGDDPDPGFSDAQRAALYAELASAAETGWDFSSRWLKNPFLGNTSFNFPALRTLNVKATIPVDLNSILHNAHVLLAELYTLPGTSPNQSRAKSHLATAESIKRAVLDLFWDSKKLAFYDFNNTAGARSDVYSMATFYPLWAGILPPELSAHGTGDDGWEKAFGLFAAVNMVLNKYNGTVPVTFFESGLQWDFPNTWPPHQHIILQALRQVPDRLAKHALPTPKSGQTTFDLVPQGQLGPHLTSAQDLPPQLKGLGTDTFPKGVDVNTLSQGKTVVNGGEAGDRMAEGWVNVLIREVSNRYVASALCSWHATGGSIPGVLPRLPDAQLEVTKSVNNTGNMFEKFSVLDIDSAGRGGEYTVQAGFGWTNGVVLWIAGEFGKVLQKPTCRSLVP